MARKSKTLYAAQYYQSEESKLNAYAVTPDEQAWAQIEPTYSLEEAIRVARGWGTMGIYKASRVVELDAEGRPVSVAWASAWEKPISTTEQGGSSPGTPGESIKLHVWMDREEGPPDHWDWVGKFGPIVSNHNAWDFEYGREVATRGRQVCYSIKINLWPVKKKPVARWNWWKIFGKDPELQRDEVEVVRAHEIEPRSFPSGVDTVDCAWCGKTHVKSLSWRAYNPDTDDMEWFDRCRCIDDKLGVDSYRIDPDGEEKEEPGCVLQEAVIR